MASGWNYEQTKALISVWGQENVQRELDGVARNKTIYERISSELRKMDVEKMWQQCRSKIKNLTFRYRKVKDSNSVSGQGRTTCPFYSEVDAILGTRAASSPPVLLDSSTSEIYHTLDHDDGETAEGLNDSSSGGGTGASGSGGGGEESARGEGSGSGGGGEESSTGGGGEESARGEGSGRGEESGRGGGSGSGGGERTRQRGVKRKRREELPAELGVLLSELNKQSMELMDEHHRKVIILEAELEAKRREQEQQHEERMLGMMMSLIHQVALSPQTSFQPPFAAQPPYNFQQTFARQFPLPSPGPPTNPSHSPPNHTYPPNFYDGQDSS